MQLYHPKCVHHIFFRSLGLVYSDPFDLSSMAFMCLTCTTEASQDAHVYKKACILNSKAETGYLQFVSTSTVVIFLLFLVQECLMEKLM